jgi:zinc transporter 7
MARRGAFRTAIASCVFVLAACAAASQIKGSAAAIDSLSLEELDGRLQVLCRFELFSIAKQNYC